MQAIFPQKTACLLFFKDFKCCCSRLLPKCYQLMRLSYNRECRWILKRIFPNVWMARCYAVWVFSVAALGAVQGAPLSSVLRPEHLTPTLRPVAPPGESESIAFSRSLEQFSQRTQRDDFSALLDFLDAYPHGAWSSALRLQMAQEYYQTCGTSGDKARQPRQPSLRLGQEFD